MKKAIVFLLFIFTILSAFSFIGCNSDDELASGSNLTGENKKVYDICVKIFNRIDSPEKCDLESGGFDNITGNGYFSISGDDSTWYMYEKSTGKVFTYTEVLLKYGSSSFQFDDMISIGSYSDSYIDYDKINEALDEKFNT